VIREEKKQEEVTTALKQAADRLEASAMRMASMLARIDREIKADLARLTAD
jgi:hypothetical protein